MTLASLRRPSLRLPPVALDALLYGGSAIFAWLLWANSTLSPHRDWGRDSIAGYAVCALAALVLLVVSPRRMLAARAVLAGVCLVLVGFVPMLLMVRDRAASGGELHVLPEVAVIERAGAHLAHGQNPYVADVVNGKLEGEVPGVPRYEAFFPYFPLMTAFGLPSTVGWLGMWGDARLWMAACTLACLAAALLLARPPPDRSLRAVQAMLVLPSGALFLAGGGDDLPVLAISLLGLVAMRRRHEVATGVAFGIAMAMKLTAWPLAALSLFVVRDREGRRVPLRVASIMGAIVAVVVLPFAIWDPRTFFANTVGFPLGLSPIKSPAASPLPGHLIATLVPGAHRVLLVGLLAVGTPLVIWWLRRHQPTDVTGVCRQTALLAVIVMCVAPATRVGYVVYPINLLVWSWLLADVPAAASPLERATSAQLS